MGDLNWTPEFWVNLFALVPIASVLGITLRYHLKTRFKHTRYLSLMWVGGTFWCLGDALSQLFLSVPLHTVASYGLVVLAFAQIFLYDAIDRESVDPVKLSVNAVLFSIYVYSTFQPGKIYVDPNLPYGPGVTLTDDMYLAGAIGSILGGFIAIYYNLKVFFKAPRYLRVRAGLIILSTIIIASGLVGGYLTGANRAFPGVDNISMAIGATLKAIVWVRTPALGFVLPFRVYRLAVVERDSGLPVYVKRWREELGESDEVDSRDAEVNDALFENMLHAASAVLKGAVRKGAVREVRLEQAVLIVFQFEDYPVDLVLVGNKFSTTLEHALARFADAFVLNHSKFLESPERSMLTLDASDLVEQCFGFIPHQ